MTRFCPADDDNDDDVRGTRARARNCPVRRRGAARVAAVTRSDGQSSSCVRARARVIALLPPLLPLLGVLLPRLPPIVFRSSDNNSFSYLSTANVEGVGGSGYSEKIFGNNFFTFLSRSQSSRDSRSARTETVTAKLSPLSCSQVFRFTSKVSVFFFLTAKFGNFFLIRKWLKRSSSTRERPSFGRQGFESPSSIVGCPIRSSAAAQHRPSPTPRPPAAAAAT